MSKQSGRMIYVPNILIEEVEDLRAEHNLNRRTDAMYKLADYARVGREAERLATFNLKWPVTKRKR